MVMQVLSCFVSMLCEVHFITKMLKIPRATLQFVKCLLSFFNVCSSTDDYQKKSHKGDGRACPLVRPCKLTRIHRYGQSFWAGSVCNLFLPLLAIPIDHLQRVTLTNIMGMCRNSALDCLFIHWHKLVFPLHFSPDRTQQPLFLECAFFCCFFFQLDTHTHNCASTIFICIYFNGGKFFVLIVIPGLFFCGWKSNV